MLFLIELDHVKSGLPLTHEAGRTFIQEVIFPTLARAEQLVAAGKILAGGPVVGSVALRLIVRADSAEEADQLVSSLPLWPLAKTRVTPLTTLVERRARVEELLKTLVAR